MIASVPLSLGEEPVYDTVLYGLMAFELGLAGVLVASRRPGNRIVSERTVAPALTADRCWH